MTDIGQRILSARKAAQSDEERIRRFETGKRPRGQRILSARKAAQSDEERIRRFKEEQRRKREWISFVEIAEWYSGLGPTNPKKAAAAAEQAYRMLQSDLLAGLFEEGGHSRVLFRFPGVDFTAGKMTRQRLQGAIDHDLDGEHVRLLLRHCWLPQDLFERWRAWRHLPESVPRFEPQESHRLGKGKQRAQPSEKGGRPPAVDWRRRPAQERIRQELEKKAPEYIDSPGRKTCWSIAQILVETRGSARKFDLDKTSKVLKRYYAHRPKD
jgi:hypothetical protein